MDQAGNNGSVGAWLDGDVLRVAISGAANVDHFIEAISQAVELDGEQQTRCMLLDFCGIDELDLSDDDIFRIVSSLRRRLRRSPDYRVAVVAPVELLGRLGDEFVRVRNLLAGDGTAVPPVQPFTELVAAEAWIRDSTD